MRLNTPHTPREAEILHDALQVLETYGLPGKEVKLKPGDTYRRADAAVQLRVAGKQVPFAVEIKRWLTPGALGHVAAQVRELDQNVLLVTDYATPPVAEKLRALDIPFVDVAGNAYFHYPPVLIWVAGRKPATTTRPPRAGRAFQPKGLKLIFALLCRPDLLKKPFRDIAAFAGVAHGTVGWVLKDLRELGYLLELGNKRNPVRKLRNRDKLLAQWTEAYARTLRPQLLIDRYEAPDPHWWKKLDAAKYGALLGGEPAAAILTKHLQPEIVTLYMQDTPARMIVDHGLRKAVNGKVELRRRFWTFDYDWRYPALTPPVLIYADLLATGDARCIETAQLLYEKYLARLIAED